VNDDEPMPKIPFIMLDQSDLGDPIGETVKCPHCHQDHKVEYGQRRLEDGTLVPSKMCGFFKCGGKSYLCALDGRSVMKRFNHE